MEKQEINRRMAAQSEEFRAAAIFGQETARCTQTPVVDDDYPHRRHMYEAALRNLIDAMKANGRFVDGNPFGLKMLGADVSTAAASPTPEPRYLAIIDLEGLRRAMTHGHEITHRPKDNIEADWTLSCYSRHSTPYIHPEEVSRDELNRAFSAYDYRVKVL